MSKKLRGIGRESGGPREAGIAGGRKWQMVANAAKMTSQRKDSGVKRSLMILK